MALRTSLREIYSTVTLSGRDATTYSWPELYRITDDGTTLFWKISVEGTPMATLARHAPATIHTEHGQLHTSFPQHGETNIYEGKNIGRSNETTPLEQALFEAHAKYLLKLAKGYHVSQNTQRHVLSQTHYHFPLGPMLAHKFNEQGHKIQWPAYCQPKLDGIRCIAIIQDGKAQLFSRTGKQFFALPHIVKALEELFAQQTIILDGELYNHIYHDGFSQIVSSVKRDEPGEHSHLVQYHIYDIASTNGKPFSHRTTLLYQYLSTGATTILQYVPTTLIESEDEIVQKFHLAREHGYEGIMIRNVNSPYEQKRSYHLQKVKEFTDAEFRIIDALEGQGKLEGHVGAFVCALDNKGTTFKVKMSGSHEWLRQCWHDESLWRDKWLTVQFQGYGSQGRPRAPIGLRIRDTSVD